MKALVLINFKPQKLPINLNKIIIKFVKSKKIKSIYGEVVDNSIRLRIGEWDFLAKARTKKSLLESPRLPLRKRKSMDSSALGNTRKKSERRSL